MPGMVSFFSEAKVVAPNLARGHNCGHGPNALLRRLCGPRLAASWNKRTTGTSCFHAVDGWRRTWSTTGVFDDNAWPVPARCSHSRHHCTFVSRPIATPSAEGERRCIYASSHAVETFARFLWASLSRGEFVAFGASFWSVQAGRFLHRLAATVPLARRRRTRSLTRIAHDQRRGASSLRRLRRAGSGSRVESCDHATTCKARCLSAPRPSTVAVHPRSKSHHARAHMATNESTQHRQRRRQRLVVAAHVQKL